MTSALFQETPGRGLPGMKATSTRFEDVISAVNASAAGVQVGKFVTRDTTAERLAKVMSTIDHGAPRAIMGLVLREAAREYTGGIVPQYETMSLYRVGTAWVECEDAFVIGSPVFVRCVVAGAEVAGSVRASADSTDCVRIPGVFLTAGDAGDYGIIQFNLGTLASVEDASDVSDLLDTHIADASAAHAASAIAFTPAGAIAATNVQTALAELDTEKVAIPGSSAAGDILYHNGTSYVRLAKGTAGQVLTMNAGATAPEWQTP
jgi:hypothetical protein